MMSTVFHIDFVPDLLPVHNNCGEFGNSKFFISCSANLDL
jgi:hypothetical protein